MLFTLFQIQSARMRVRIDVINIAAQLRIRDTMITPMTKALRWTGQLMSMELVIIMMWKPVMRMTMVTLLNRRITTLFIEQLTERYKLSSNPMHNIIMLSKTFLVKRKYLICVAFTQFCYLSRMKYKQIVVVVAKD